MACRARSPPPPKRKILSQIPHTSLFPFHPQPPLNSASKCPVQKRARTPAHASEKAPPGAHAETRGWRRAVAAHLRAFRFCIWINWRFLRSVNARKRKIKMCRTVSKTPSRNARGLSPLVISRCHRENNNAPYPQHTLLSMKSCCQHTSYRQALSTVFFDFSMTQFIYPTSRVQESGFGF